jgi:hypothetical protein
LPEGDSLRSLMDAGATPSVEARVDILSQLCEALLHSQEHGVAQFGLRPAGIFVTASSQVTVVPFGTIPIFGSGGTLAALSRDEIAYLAPEVVENRMPDRRADVFSIGVIGFELLAGRRPFEAANIPALLHALVHEEPDRAAIPSSRYSPDLERVILTALARDPANRYSDAGVMLAEFEALTLEAPSTSTAAVAPVATSASTEFETDAFRAQALALAADGCFLEALTLLARIEARAPGDLRNPLLRDYLRDEEAEYALLATVERHMSQGRLREARATAGEVLALNPSRARARELVRQLDRMLFALRGHSFSNPSPGFPP